ncbi:exodeoxyribonuclease VII large subunit [Thermosediminibacter oceani]|uniref:Exodeoxyribonuclease 7 large subunit n=1 Tax=Thermosediminibacter oceani (strain ATCC BAA-1034 / DSM 16646 / JW/IW-1228P) TaxID=555079 RepID=D9S3T8_THEOJ|nr:exodeoxyribonuclease VII large subunit [Thermosediminibacter oceani]ADL08065.1 Exodeoxyribonuclease VII large subunit [Thermosediminibacter oceani DSM 16646]
MAAPVLTVSELTGIIKYLFDSNEILRQVYVRGEISNFKYHLSGHIYFVLKDEKAQIRCVMFKNKSVLLPFMPENGMRVVAFGYVTVYEKNGEYQLYVDDMEPDGIGALYLAYEKLKAKLQKEGLFDANRKKAIPFLPKNIGIITSINGAAIKDLLTVIRRRFPNVNILIAPVSVQGKQAADEICEAIKDLNRIGKLDVIIVARGGGSIEELWTFNEEKVARAIYSSRIPIISAVGHETDYTIADFVADKRAPTPSAAGEMVVPEKNQLLADIDQRKKRIIAAMCAFLNTRKQGIEYIRRSVVFRKLRSEVDNNRIQLDVLTRRLLRETMNQITVKKSALKSLMGRLDVLSPLSVLDRGYSICQTIDDLRIVKRVEEVSSGEEVKVILSNGYLLCEVRSKGKKVVRENGRV